MTIPKELTTVTLVSRIVELIVLIAAMIISFGLGVNYQETIYLLKQQNSSLNATTIKPTTPTLLPPEASTKDDDEIVK